VQSTQVCAPSTFWVHRSVLLPRSGYTGLCSFHVLGTQVCAPSTFWVHKSVLLPRSGYTGLCSFHVLGTQVCALPCSGYTDLYSLHVLSTQVCAPYTFWIHRSVLLPCSNYFARSVPSVLCKQLRTKHYNSATYTFLLQLGVSSLGYSYTENKSDEKKFLCKKYELTARHRNLQDHKSDAVQSLQTFIVTDTCTGMECECSTRRSNEASIIICSGSIKSVAGIWSWLEQD
jgi:hypothetical protein